MAEPVIEPAISYSQVRNATESAMGLGIIYIWPGRDIINISGKTRLRSNSTFVFTSFFKYNYRGPAWLSGQVFDSNSEVLGWSHAVSSFFVGRGVGVPWQDTLESQPSAGETQERHK